MNQAQKQCPNCQQYKMMPRWFNVFILGLALITMIPTLMLIAAITVVGLLIEQEIQAALTEHMGEGQSEQPVHPAPERGRRALNGRGGRGEDLGSRIHAGSLGSRPVGCG